jgi:TolB-like protein
MMNLLAELKRRQMFRVAAAYAVIAWILLQLVNNLTPALRLPDWAATFVVVLLIVGFPVALLFCWIQHLPSADGSAPSVKAGKLDWVLIGALGMVILLIGYQQITPSSDATTQQAGVVGARDASASPATAISLAVLPFTNLSGDASQEFFSDGITEEIIAALARIPDLRVVARGSASQFKGERRDLRAVGQALGATHLIEGSVRKAGTRVRITAQLVKADDGVNAWVNTYDRELTDVFAIQEEIATAIAGALRMPLGLRPGERLVSNRDIDPESYQQYLGARAIIRTVVNQPGAAERRIAAIEALEQVVARYPGYAPAWAQLALGYHRRFNIGLRLGTVERRRAKDEWLPKAEAAARRAIELDANLADGYSILGKIMEASRGDLAQADELYSKALALDPFHPEARHFYALLLGAVGRVKEALAMREQLRVMEPFIGIYNSNIEELRWIGGQTDTVALMERLSAARIRGGPARAMLARIYSEQGRYTEAVDALMAIRPPPYTQEALDAAVGLLRTAPAAATSRQNLPRLANNLEFVYLHVGAPEHVLQPFEDDIADGEIPGDDMVWLWHPSYAPARKTERFKAFARNAGLVDYWRAKGWPEFCRPVTPERASAKAGPMGADDFACE